MNTKVRDLFRIETKDIVSFTNFNQIYYVFEQMVLYDIDVPEIEGLSERVPYALNKIATEKLDRNDIITFFPIIWGKFEPYVRKLLYIINPSKYREVKNNKNSSVVNVLAELGIKVFVQEKDRTKETEAIYTTYSLRNAEAHVCETWSIRKCYDKLAKTFAALLIVTNKVLPGIQKRMEGLPDEKRIDVPLLDNVPSINVDIFDGRLMSLFNNLNDCFSQYHRIDGNEFNRQGWLISSDNGICKNTYEYEFQGNKIVKCNVICDGKIERYYTYSYDDLNQLILIQRYRGYYSENGFFLFIIVEIEYLTDGGLCITYKQLRNKNIQYRSSIRNISEESENEVKSTKKQLFDSGGRLIKYSSGNYSAKYTYSENGLLRRVDYPNYRYDEIKYVGDNAVTIKKDRDDEIGRIDEKRLFKNGRLKKIQYYTYEDRDGNKLDDPTITRESIIEYFDEK